MKKPELASAILIAAMVASTPTAAYVGPGAGITLLGALWAVIAAVVLAIGGLLVWPIRLWLLRRKAASAEKKDGTETAEDDNPKKP